MSTYNNTPNFSEFSDSDLELCHAILAFDEFITNVDDEYPSYHLLSTLNDRIKRAYNSLTEHYTYEFESMFAQHHINAPKEGFHLFQVITGGKADN